MQKRLFKITCAAVSAVLLFTAMGGMPASARADTAQAFLPGCEKLLSTKYPIVLAHGAGFRDDGLLSYWGRIPVFLRLHGARVFMGRQDAFGSIESNAEILKRSVNRALAVTGAERVNIIAHSKGGIEARYMISSLGMEDKVASLTTLSTPHHGSKTVDIYMHFPAWLRRVIAMPVNLSFRLQGDRNPDFFNGSESLTTAYMAEFNQSNPDAPGVYYQSWAGRMSTVWSDPIIAPVFVVVSWFDGPNDGLVSVESSQWGNYRGVVRSNGRRGVSHADLGDYRRMRLNLLENSSDGYSSILDFYVDMIVELREMGF